MKRNSFFYNALIVILSAVFIISGIQVASYLIDSMQQKDTYNELAAIVEQSRGEITPPAPVEPEADTTIPADNPTEPVILPEYVPLYEKNADTVGWMEIEGTRINYPVMQTPDRPDYYLKRNFNHERSAHGCLYVRESCDVFAPSDNVTIYGHHMKDGSMFADLESFLYQDFWENHPTIRFDTLYEHHTYTIFAVFRTTASLDEGFAYHHFEDAQDEADFDDFISSCKELSLYDTGITPQYGDKLICLSTCEYTRANGRLVVVAVRDAQDNGVA